MNNNYALVNIFGRQYKVSEGSAITASFHESELGTQLQFDEVLMLKNADNTKLGAPFVQGAKVHATVESHGRHDKVLVFKYLKKNKSKKMLGHKQPYTTLKITKIEA